MSLEASTRNSVSAILACSKIHFWLDTIYINIRPEYLSMRPGQALQSPEVRVRGLQESLYFHVVQVSKHDLGVFCTRKFPNLVAERNAESYDVFIDFDMIGFYDLPSTRKMSFCERTTCFTCKTEQLEMFREMNCNRPYTIKVRIQLHETGQLRKSTRMPQQNFLRKIEDCIEYDKLAKLFLILNLPSLADVFTGCRNVDFMPKLILILRALNCADELNVYFKAKRNGDASLPNIPISRALNCLLKNTRDPISDGDVILLYLVAHSTGLNFVKEVVTDYIIRKADNLDFLVQMLLATHHVDDRALFRKLAYHFLLHHSEILRSEAWYETVMHSVHMARSIIHSVVVLGYMKTPLLLRHLIGVWKCTWRF